MEIVDRLGDDTSHADHRKTANRKIAANDRAGADGRTTFHQGGKCVFVGRAAAKLLQITRRRARKNIVREDHPCGNHHAIFDGDGVADVGVGIDLHPIADRYTVSNRRFATDETLLAQRRAVADMSAIPHARAISKMDVLFDDGGGMDANSHGQVFSIEAGTKDQNGGANN